MDERIRDVINSKIDECRSDTARVNMLVDALSPLHAMEGKHALALGIVIGRLYNSFYYQSRRILMRDPSDDEFQEFVRLVLARIDELVSDAGGKVVTDG
ncbi:MAG: hypothetical protein RMJ59_07345 [Candidatus Nitrosocaldus sp.]|nr:hypothetical protein [Candidatus Nitrosocaldus sp.]MCS7141980.1 hypothetical protein [Candidatus Nitrosocaldus sp.]MDW8000671.1 hypothetical protein [Candidatus Nitrosocaldus sp.]MDW8276174.1 hypothetical protein [Candidatus Nitrosocaldus sp.]